MGILDFFSNIHDDPQPAASGRARGPCATLLAHGIDPSGLKFTLNQDGSVKVSGRVRDMSECDRICRAIESMPLVEGVVNGMTLDATAPALAPGMRKRCG